MKRYVIYILLILLCVNLHQFARGEGAYLESKNSPDSISVISGYFDDIWNVPRPLPDQDDETQSIRQETALENGPYQDELYLQEMAASNADPSGKALQWMDALEAEGILDLGTPSLQDIEMWNYGSMLLRTSDLAKRRAARTQRDLILANAGKSDLGAGPLALQSVRQEVSLELDSIAEKIKSSPLSSRELREKSRFLDRIHLRAEMAVL